MDSDSNHLPILKSGRFQNIAKIFVHWVKKDVTKRQQMRGQDELFKLRKSEFFGGYEVSRNRLAANHHFM